MKLVLLTLLLYTAGYLCSAQFFQCKERNSCQQNYLERQTRDELNKLKQRVRKELSDKVTELDEYNAKHSMGNRIGEYLSERLGMGMPELSDISRAFNKSISEFWLDGEDDVIQDQLIAHASTVPLYELIRALERERWGTLVRAIKNNKECVQKYIRRLYESNEGDNSDRDGARRIYERLRMLLRALRTLASPTEAEIVVQSIREVRNGYEIGGACRRAWTANIACRTCNNSVTGRPIPRACPGLCSSTLWVCLSPLLYVLRGSNDVIRYRRSLAEILFTQDSSLDTTVPSVMAIAEELETLTRRAIENSRKLDLVEKLPQIAEACNIDAELPESETPNNISVISGVSNEGGENSDRPTTQPDDSTENTSDADGDTGEGRDSRRRREVQPLSLPLPPQRLMPIFFKGIIGSLCRENNSSSRAGVCWNGTQVAPYMHNTDYMNFDLEAVELIYTASGVEWDREEFLAETAELSGPTDPCTAIQGDSEAYYTAVSDQSESVCFEEMLFGSGSSHLTVYLSLLTLAISLVLYSAFL